MNVGNILILTLFFFTLQEDSNASDRHSNSGEDLIKRSDNHDGKRFLVNQPVTGAPQGAQWSDWGSWSQCLLSGNRYIIERFRKCDNPPPSLFGRDCDGIPVEMHPCVIASWSTWSAWSQCSCDSNHTRSRQCNGASNGGIIIQCAGLAREVGQCVPDPARNCPINGGWSIWSSWLSCSATCGQGTAKRLRLCSNPVPKNGGTHCVGSSVDSKVCMEMDCPTSPRMCQVCSGPPIICENLYELQQCPLDKQYCINTVDNRADASRYVVRKCGTKDECRTGWFEQYSSNDKCINFSRHYVFTSQFYCEFCCDTDGCNGNVNMDNKWHP